jgi:predicted signal transduction protein with EAL and GGDEF domain
VVAFEALARWRDPELGDVRPDVFVPVAEESGLIGSLGSRVLRMAIAEASSWSPPLGVSVNLSPIQVQSPDFCDEVVALLAEY